MSKKTIGIMCATFNEEENIEALYLKIDETIQRLNNNYELNFLFIDNDSTDNTQKILRKLAKKDKRIKCIFNERNFNANRSSFHGLLNCSGDAVIMICADFQDPPELLPDLIKKWESGSRIVMARKLSSDEPFTQKTLRRFYYYLLGKVQPACRRVKNCTGFGIYDNSIINSLRNINDVTPFFRGIIADLFSDIDYVEYHRPRRRSGISGINFADLWDEGIVGLISNSKLSIRFLTLFGVICGIIAFLLSILILTLKIVYWHNFPMGVAPILILQLFTLAVVMFSLGILGEYIGGIYTQIFFRQRVYERERINFDES